MSSSFRSQSSAKQVAIVGGGLIGLLCAHRLVAQGAEVTLFEARQPGAPGTPSGLQMHVFGAHQTLSSDRLEALVQARRAWSTLEQSLDMQLVFGRGVLRLARADNAAGQEALADYETQVTASQIRNTTLDPIELAQTFPAFDWTTVGSGLWMPDWGVLFPRRVIARLRFLLEGKGLTVCARQPVTAIDPARGCVTWADGSAHFDQVILAAGAGIPALYPAITETCRGYGYLRLTLHPSAERVRALVRAPVVLDPEGSGLMITTLEAGADLSLCSLGPVTDCPADAIPTAPQEARGHPSVKALFERGIHMFQRPGDIAPKQARLFYELAARDGEAVVHQDERLTVLVSPTRDGGAVAPVLAEAAL
ncbi:MAG: NAD(P)/FAD-dependent oxidoreductase [Rhodospirillaceae bacterium]